MGLRPSRCSQANIKTLNFEIIKIKNKLNNQGLVAKLLKLLKKIR